MAVRSILKLSEIILKPPLHCLEVSQRALNQYVRKTSMALRKRQEKYFEQLKPEEKLELGRRNKFIEWNYSSEIFAFGKRLHEDFLPELLVQAFTHRSYVVQEELKLKELGVETQDLNLKDNDKLAQEGERIILNWVPRYVSNFFPRFPLEGINGVTEYLMSEQVLAHVSKNLGTTFLILSAEYPPQPETYAKTLKAIIGALNESQGIKRANIFVRDFIVTQLAGKDINDYLKIDQPLEKLNEIFKREGREACEPRIICQSAMNTIMANYHIGLYSNKQLVGHSPGESVDIAIEMAAYDALRRLFHTTDSCSPIKYDVENIPETVTNISLNEWSSGAFEQTSNLPASNQTIS